TRSQVTHDYVKLSAHAKNVARKLKVDHPERQVELRIGPNVTAKGDARLLLIAMENLLGNAWKFTAKCPVARIEFGVTTATGQKAFFIRDNGAGFNMANVGKLFGVRSEEHTSELQSRENLVCRLLLEKK